MNVSASRSNRRVPRRYVAHQQRCRRFRKAEFYDHSSAHRRSSDPISRSLVLTIQVGVGLWPGVPVETWSEIPRGELSIVFRALLKNHALWLDTVSTTRGSGWVHAQRLCLLACGAPTRYRGWY